MTLPSCQPPNSNKNRRGGGGRSIQSHPDWGLWSMQQQQQQRRRQKPEVKTKKRKKKFPIGGRGKTQDGKEIDFGNGHDRKKEEVGGKD